MILETFLKIFLVPIENILLVILDFDFDISAKKMFFSFFCRYYEYLRELSMTEIAMFLLGAVLFLLGIWTYLFT